MKKVFLFLGVGLSLLLTEVHAGQNFGQIEWNSSAYMGVFNFQNLYASRIILDVGSTGEFYSFNGAVEYTNGGALPCTGSGYITSSNTLAVGLQCGTMSVDLEANLYSLNGTMRVYNNDMVLSNSNIYLSYFQ